MASLLLPSAQQAAPMLPLSYRVIDSQQETHDTWTLRLEPQGPEIVPPRPGQFNMLYALGVGEVPISVSALGDGHLIHTIRDVGCVTHALCALRPGDLVGVRGPFGNSWPLERAWGRDLLIVAGGIGLAPLRPAVHEALADLEAFRSVTVLYGARAPEELLYLKEVDFWTRLGAECLVAVDREAVGWGGRVCLVPRLVDEARFDDPLALVCGPEVMFRYTYEALAARGVPAERVYVSMERTMRCGVGLCGHCQLGPTLICRDGPVYRYDVVERLMEVKEL